ncbi:MAG TPA: hypothetical protein VF746_15180 [Longimicrobium sp.]|jgi:seryl-tRNA synthetase
MSATDILKKLSELYEEIVVTKARFESLEKITNSAISELRTAVVRFEDDLRRMDREHIRERAELSAKIESLSARLDTLSEGALHAVAREAARDALLKRPEIIHTAGGEVTPFSLPSSGPRPPP